MLTKTENYEKSWVVLNMAKWCFLGLFFWGSNIKKVCFWCVWHCFKSVKVFPSFLGFSGVTYCCSSGFGRFRCFCVSCVCFSFLCCFCFCFVCFAIGFVVGWMLLFCFLCFFFGGLKGQVRWPKGPPHLALNPPYFFCFVFFLFFVFFFVLLFLFFLVFWGFKGQVRWPKGPPHLALDPPYVICFVFLVFLFFFVSLVFVFARKNRFPPPKRTFVVYFSVSPFVSL